MKKYKLAKLYRIKPDPETRYLATKKEFPDDETVKYLFKNKGLREKYWMKLYIQKTPFWYRDYENINSVIFNQILEAVLNEKLPYDNVCIDPLWFIAEDEFEGEGGYSLEAKNADISFYVEYRGEQNPWFYDGEINGKHFKGIASHLRFAIAKSLKCIHQYAKHYYPEINKMFESKTLRYQMFCCC